MRRRPSKLLAVTAAFSVAVVLTGCEARVYGSSDQDQTTSSTHLTMVAPQSADVAAPQEPPQEAVSFDGLAERATLATANAADEGADITFLILDRSTRQQVSNGNNRGIAIASVVKLFIADELLRGAPLNPDDMKLFESMLRRSDDSAAESFWNRLGGSAIIPKVVARYGLTGTRPPNNGRWWNTISTASDLVRFYDMMLSGEGGLPKDKVELIVSNLFQSNPTALDGTQPGGVYPQRFGIPDGLPGDKVGVKQGWMCCIGSDWMHLSTGIIGTDRRYIMVIGSDQPAGAAQARATITAAVKTMFPTGSV